MKILILPDIHGRTFWKKPCEDISQWDKVVFLGDYVDPYEGEVLRSEVVPNLQEIIALKEVYKDKVILLWGNHDLFYWCDPYRDAFDYWSRHDNIRHDEIESIFKQHNELFQFAWQYGKFLFTHSGVNNTLAREICEYYKADEVTATFINDYYKDNLKELSKVSYYRGGWERYSSVVWADVQEHYGKEPCKEIKELYQIFGHTYCKVRLVTKWWAMLDTGGGYAYLDDGILKDPNGNKIKLVENDPGN